jgi:outer membrane protein
MRVLAAVPALSMMLAAVAFAQGQAPAPAPATAAQAPAPQDQTLADADQLPPQQVPFREGFKYAYINIQEIVARSKEGQQASTSINAMREKFSKELAEREKAMQSTQQKLQSQGAVLSDTARLQLQTELERQQRDLQRMAEDAQQDIDRFTERLQQEFMTKLNPVIDRVAMEKKVDLIFNAADSGLVWAAPGTNLTNEVIAAFDQSSGAKPAAAAPASSTPTAAAAPAAGR